MILSSNALVQFNTQELEAESPNRLGAGSPESQAQNTEPRSAENEAAKEAENLIDNSDNDLQQ